MDLSRALQDIADIHAQIAKGEIYRGYRPLPVAASGLIGIAAAWTQPQGLGPDDPPGFVLYWAAIAVLAGFVGVSEIVYNYVVHDDGAERRHTRRVVGQFVPGVLAGAIVTASFVRLNAGLVPLLPGIWAICFGVGTFASRPYLPRTSSIVALFYYGAGVVLLWATSVEKLSGWWVGGTFGAGQLLAAAVLYWESGSRGAKEPEARSDDEEEESRED